MLGTSKFEPHLERIFSNLLVFLISFSYVSPVCGLQINHMYEERRLLVAQSCGELAEFVWPEIRDSLILSIIQQLIEDSATVVREAAAHNLALPLPLFQTMDKYFKVSLTNMLQRLSWRGILT